MMHFTFSDSFESKPLHLDSKMVLTDCAAVVIMCWYLIVALHSVDECLISHNLRVSIEEGLETILGLLKLLLGYLWKQGQTEVNSDLKPE